MIDPAGDLLLRRLVRLALLLALVVAGASSYLRLAGNGLGCGPWPACYGTPEAAQAAAASAVVQALRVAHRLAATSFLVVAVALVWRGWRRWDRGARGAGVALLAVTVLLAAVGLITPSPWPWVTWVNLLGGFALVALLLWLRAPRDAAAPGAIAVLLLALLVVQSAGGTLISTRLAAGACAPDCTVRAAGDFAALWNPLRAGTAAELAGAGGAALLHAMHRIGGLALAVAALLWSLGRGEPVRGAAWSAGAVLALGLLATSGGWPSAGAAHALAAALLVATCAASLRGTQRAAPAAEVASTASSIDAPAGRATAGRGASHAGAAA